MAKKIPIGLQLYSIREECKKDMAGTLKAVAKMGYQGVEFAGYFNLSAADLKKMLDDNGLVCCGTHIKIDTLVGDELPKTIEYNRGLGNRFLIVPGLAPQYTATLDAWKKTAEIFNGIAEKVKPAGMRTGYHNHHIEFTAVDGKYPWDAFFSTCRPDVVMQLDTGNARHAGVDVAPYISRYPGRATTVHLKEWTDAPDASGKGHQAVVIGEGKVPWQTIFTLCETVGKTEWYIVEQEVYAAAPLVTVKQCLDNLRKMGK